MKKYTQFIFEGYDFDRATRTASLRYSLDGEVTFTETWKFDFEFADYDPATLDRALFGLLLMAGVSYYKAVLPAAIVIKQGSLSPDQKAFFDKAYQLGLGEFFFRNQISPHGAVDFPPTADRPSPTANDQELIPNAKREERAPERSAVGDGRLALLPIGGGKDSLVSAELLAAGGVDYATWVVNQTPLVRPMLDRLGSKPHLAVTRTIAPELLRLNAEGAQNGHVPISAILSFAAVVTAVLTGRRDIILSEEASAGEANVQYEGVPINHQFSKTLEFEQMFQEYLSAYISPNIRYFSLLRPLIELKIAEIFTRTPFATREPLTAQRSKNEEQEAMNINQRSAVSGQRLAKTESLLTKYHGAFSSCNTNFRQGNQHPLTWCGHCPKCAFVYLIFAPFVPGAQLTALFGGKDLFADPELHATFAELLGLEGHKPFECVGEIAESRQALVMARATGEYGALGQWQFADPAFDYKTLGPGRLPAEYEQILKQQIL